MVWIFSLIVLLSAGCQQNPQEYRYKEITLDTAQNNKKELLSWSIPQGWVEEAGNDLRLASFHLSSDKQAFDCSIVSLDGIAGGLEANLSRWMGQLGLPVSSENLNKLISSAKSIHTKDGIPVNVYDFSVLQSTDKTMMAAMLMINQTSIFIKMTGSMEAIRNNRESFLKLTASIAKKS